MAKPAGPTSHDVVQRVRRATGEKAGHAGTLDPFATGLLVVAVGHATRYQDSLTGLDKGYDATAELGVRSSSGDPEGRLERTGCETTEEDVLRALPGLVGELRQRVPALSAVKVGGERLHRLTRRDESVERPVRTVRVDSLDLIGFSNGSADLRIRCSKGTYVRQLISDLGDRLGCGAYCSRLERTSVGPFRLEEAATLEEIDGAQDVTRLAAWRPLEVSAGGISLLRLAAQ